MTVGELLHRTTSRELSEWMAYASVEPFGERRADYRVAILSSLTYNANRAKGAKPLGPNDFMPFLGPDGGE